MAHRKSVRFGRCYEMCYKYCVEESERELVHGIVTDPTRGLKIHHAWVETKEGIYDGVLDVLIPTEIYKKLFTAQAIHVYSREEALDWAEKAKEYGPWESLPELDVSHWEERDRLKK